MEKRNFYFKYRNVGVLPCSLSILLVHYIMEKGADYFGITLVKMSNFLIAEIIILIAIIGCFMIEMWLIVQLAKEMFGAWFAIDRTGSQFFGKLVMQLIEKRKEKNDCKKL